MNPKTIISCVIIIVFVYFFTEVKPSEETANLETLQLVQILFRHGDRTPTRSYPTDPYSNVAEYWPQGIGQLTNIGKIQHYNLGKYFRRRYGNFLSREYIPREIYVLASDLDRTIMSAQMNLAGLYEPVDSDQNWNPTIPWTPVPVRTIPHGEDNLLHSSKPCPKYHRLYREFQQNDPMVQTMEKEYKNFVEYVSQNAGTDGNTIGDIVGIDDVLQVDLIHNYSLPGWAEPIVDKFHEIASNHYTMTTYTTEMKRLKGGPLWKVFLKNMKHAASSESSEEIGLKLRPKLYMYSAHDSTLTRLMNTLGVYDGVMPPYAAAFIVELHKDNNGDYYVQMFYRNETHTAPYAKEMSGCPAPCSLNQLVDVTSSIVPEDWESECKDHSFDSKLQPPPASSETDASDSAGAIQALILVASMFAFLVGLLYISRNKINLDLFTYRMPLPSKCRSRAYRNTYEVL